MRFQNESFRAPGRAMLAWTIVALAVLAFTVGTAAAAVMTNSAATPTVDGHDIANLATSTGSDKWWPGAANVYGNPGKTVGQTFTTPGEDVWLNAFTFQVTSGTQPTKNYNIRVGSVSGSTFTEIHSETATQSFATAASDYWTWTLDTPVQLSPNTVYGVDVGIASSTSGWTTGIPYVYYTGNSYSDGTRFRSGTAGNGVGDDSMTHMSGDRVFHIDLESASWLKGQLGILDVSGTNPATGEPWKYGDTYRFAFHTNSDTGRAQATSTDIEWYNTFVQDLADASTAYDIGADDGATWKVIGSTADVDARDNTATNPNVDGDGEAIFLLDGTTLVASDYNDLWDGSIENIINLTETGEEWAFWPYTGTKQDGTKRTGGSDFSPLGGGGNVGQGQAGDPNNWVWRVWTGSTSPLPFYALSMPLSVVPEPSSAMLMLLGLIGLLMVRRKR